MASIEEQINQLEAAIAGLPALRATLGDSTVDTAVSVLRAQLETVHAQLLAQKQGSVLGSPERALERLEGYIPQELRTKMRAEGRIQGERKQVTVLFADISGYTALAERLDPEDVTVLSDDVLKEFAACVFQYEGYVDQYGGDSILAIFGAPVAHEDDPERALRAALAIRERLAIVSHRWAHLLIQPLRPHVGVHTGLVVAGHVGHDLRLHYTVMGDTINTASRLQSAAEPGQILVSRDTYRLTHDAFSFEALDPVRIKGKSESLVVFELQQAKLHPGKGRGLLGLGDAFVGREREIALLDERGVELTKGHGSIVTVLGEAGLGKSRLMAEWRTHLGESIRWFEGRSFAYSINLSFGPFLHLLRRFASISDDQTELQAREQLNRALEPYFPADLDAPAIVARALALRLSPDEEAFLSTLAAEAYHGRFLSLVKQLLRQLALERPTILTFEDLHWVDATSEELIEHLLPLSERLPLIVICIGRPETGPVFERLLTSVTARYSTRHLRLTLGPLSDTDSQRMVEQLLMTTEPPLTIRSLVLSKAEGNPFYVEEVIRTLIERGALAREGSDCGWVVTRSIETLTVPDTLHGLLMSRLDCLTDEVKAVAQYAAVIGRVFLYRVLIQIADPHLAVDEDVSTLERRELIRQRTQLPEIEYIFKHALTQEVAYESLLLARRRDLHALVGEALESLFAGRLGELTTLIANHFFRGEVWGKATYYFAQAGDAATQIFGYSEARLHYARAIEALAHLSDTEEHRRLHVDLTLKRVKVSIVSDGPDVSLDRLMAIEPIARELPPPQGEPGGDRRQLAWLHYWMGRAYYYKNEPRAAIGFYRRVLLVAQELGDEELLAIPSCLLGQVMVIQGQFGRALPLLAQATAALAKVGDWVEWSRANAYFAGVLAAHGQYSAARDEIQQTLARAREANNLSGVGLAYILMWLVEFMADNPEGMVVATQGVLDTAVRSGDRFHTYIAYGYRSLAESRLGNHAAARASMAASDNIAAALGGNLLQSDWFEATRAEMALNAGHPDEARAQAEKAAAAAKVVGNVLAEGLAQRIWALALAADPSRLDEVHEHFKASLDAFVNGAILPETARTRLAWGRFLLAHNRPVDAYEHLEMAAEVFRSTGLDRDLAQLRTLI